MLKWNIFGRGFDSRRLHQPSLGARGKRRLPRRSSNERSRAFRYYTKIPLQATARHANNDMFYYVYIIQSEEFPDHYYSGFTEDLDSRLSDHNSGKNYHTKKYRPWRIKTAIAFTDRKKALDFESYLKSPSGRAFAKKRL